MDRNLFLAIVLSMGVFTLWLMWQAEKYPTPSSPLEGEVPLAVAEGTRPIVSPTESTQVEQQWSRARTTSEVPVSTRVLPLVEEIPEQTFTFDREKYEARVTSRGGRLVSWVLKDYDERTADGNIPMELIRVAPPMDAALATPFIELGMGDLSEAGYSVASQGSDSVSFVLERAGISIRKNFEFDHGDYGFRLSVEVENDTDRRIAPGFEVLWPAVKTEGNDFNEQALAALHEGSVESSMVAGIGQPGFFGNFFGAGGDEGPPTFGGDIGWAGVNTRYFVSALIPDRSSTAAVRFDAIELGKFGATALFFQPAELGPGQSVQHSFEGYIGPKEPARLEAISPSLAKSINLGFSWISPLRRFFGWLLHATYSVIPNYGVAIILITILVRLGMAPIMSRQMKSMERMRELQPQLKEIQAKHSDDRAKQSEEMMKLYKQTGVNPLGGCLPMLLQFPVFIGLFYALQSSIDLRHAPFVLWITDLSAPETLFEIPGLGIPVRVLPLIMGGSMVLQQRLTPMTMDPAQAKMMMTMMPIMMTVLFYQFPSGLVLYWMISNFLGIGHQLLVGRRMRRK